MMQELGKILQGVQKNVELAPHTTFKIGGKARYFFIAKTKDDIIQAVKVAKKLQISFFILGGGSNLLVSDKGFNGLVIKIENCKLKIENCNVHAEAGVSMATLVKETTKRGLAGLEWAGGLPGSVGGAVRGNAGAFGGETKDAIKTVECIDAKGNVRVLSNAECKFAYRTSIFKKKKWIVLSVEFQLSKNTPAGLQKIAQSHIQYREERHPMEFPSAGSVFKNCEVKKIPSKVAEFVKDAIKIDPFPVVPTAFLLAKAGLKGMRVHGARISEKHPNYIVNAGNATAKDVQELISKIKKIIKKKFFINLEVEIERI